MNGHTLEPEKITIIEGPPPTFEPAMEYWVIGLAEGPTFPYTARCLLRTHNGPGLVKRCRDAWAEHRDVFLDYRNYEGTRKQALIVGSRYDEVEDGQVLQLWLRLDELPEGFEQQFIDDDDIDDVDDGDLDDDDLTYF